VPVMQLVPEFTHRVTTTNPLGPTDGSPHGRTQYILGTGRIEYAVHRLT
jgi:lactate dehydrogenase-like 2-hydroxyacid dehydrogenase